MSYSVELAGPAARKIAHWKLSRHLQTEILKQLDGLGASPIRHLVRLPKPADIMAYQFDVRVPGDPPRDYLGSLSVAYRTDEETLVVYDCDVLEIEVDPESPGSH